MNIRFFVTTLIALLMQWHAPSATALTMKQFSDICHSTKGECSDHPILRPYMGGAFDLLATLDEKTDSLREKVYCGEPEVLFDVPAIIRFMEERSDEYATDNAMLVLVRYFEERGGCDHK